MAHMTFDEYLVTWSTLHSNAQPSLLVRCWLRVAFFVSTPFVRFGPNSVTVMGVIFMSVVVAISPDSPAIAALCLPFVGLLDNIDGIVAVRSSRVSAYGAFLDSIADRIVDILSVAIFVRLGAHVYVGICALMTTVIHEYMRARALSLGAKDVGVISIAEKPTRIIVTAIGLVAVAVLGDHRTNVSDYVLYLWCTIGVIGLLQLWPALKKQLVNN